jgi:DedD protein
MPLPSFFERFRRGSTAGAPTAVDAVPSSSSDVEAMRVRARRRLIGMVVLVGAGVIGFPWLFETQPRPMASDIHIAQAPQSGGASAAALAAAGTGLGAATIASVRPPAPSLATTPNTAPTTTSTTTAPQGPSARVGTTAEREEFVPDAQARAASAVPAASKVDSKPVAKLADKQASRPAEKPVAKVAEKALEKAPEKTLDKAAEKKLADKKAEDKRAEDKKAADKKLADKKALDKPVTRYVVQFGAFAEAGAAHEARMKAERLGLKTYAQQVDTPQGKRIRVRLGPYADKAEADKAANALRKAGLPGAVLTL